MHIVKIWKLVGTVLRYREIILVLFSQTVITPKGKPLFSGHEIPDLDIIFIFSHSK